MDFRRRLFPHIAPVPFLRLIAGDRLFPLGIVDDKPVFIDIVLRPLVLRRLAKAVVGERGVLTSTTRPVWWSEWPAREL